MTVKECINSKTEGLGWKVVCNGIVLVTNKSCAFTSEEELKEIGKKEVITYIKGLSDLTIVVM